MSIGINLPVYLEFVRVPGYPVYYAPQASSNYIFYDGMYWVYQGDSWHASSWYNGRWGLMVPKAVPLCILRDPCGTAADLRRTFAAGAPTRRRTGAITGAAHGSRVTAGGTAGIAGAVPAPAPLPV